MKKRSSGWFKSCLLTCILFNAELSVYAQNFLDFSWHIKSGDSIQWRSPGFVPRNWGLVNIGVNLERQGYVCCSGYYTLFNQVIIPAKYKEPNNTSVHLSFKFDAEKAEVFFNGIPIGASKQPGSEEAFQLPNRLVRWDKPNQVVVRLFNPFYTGGTCSTYVYIERRNSKGWVNFQPDFENDEHVYTNSADIRFSAYANLFGRQPVDGIQKAIVINQFGDTVLSEQIKIKAHPTKTSLLYRAGKLPPGFYQVQFGFSGEGVEAQEIAAFAVTPDSIQAPQGNVEEVTAYWNKAINELAAIDPQYKLTKVDSLCSSKNNVYILEMRSLGDLTVRGWYITPAKAGVYPAIAHFQGYSVGWKPQWFLNDTDVVHLALDIRGHGLSADVINPGFGCPGYVGYNVGKPGEYIYRGAFMDAYRAVNFLLSRKEIDTMRIAVSGHSQGGGLSVAMAALHAGKIKCCVTASPWLCDFTDHIKIRPLYWDDLMYYIKRDNLSKQQVHKTMEMVDVLNLCQRIECPVLLGTGLFDDDCPSYIAFAMYNKLKAPKEYCILPQDGHLLGKEWGEFGRKWTRKMLGIQEGQ